MYRPDEMAMILEQAKQYTNSQRLAHTETAKVLLDVEFQGGIYQGAYIPLEVGKTYALRTYTEDVDITFYPVCKEYEGVQYLGNLAYIIDDESHNTGEPYILVSGDPDGSGKLASLLGLPGAESVKVHATLTAPETIHPIDQKYLPGVCLPVVELSTTFTAGASYTAEENEKLKAAYEGNTPVVIKCPVTLAGGSYKSTCNVWGIVTATDSEVLSFVCGFGGITLQIFSMDNGKTWSCNIQ